MKNTMKEVINKLNICDYKQVVRDKVIQCDEELLKLKDDDYITALKKRNSSFKLLSKTLEDENLRELILTFDEDSSNLFSIENEYIYERGFDDGVNFILNMIDICH